MAYRDGSAGGRYSGTTFRFLVGFFPIFTRKYRSVSMIKHGRQSFVFTVGTIPLGSIFYKSKFIP